MSQISLTFPDGNARDFDAGDHPCRSRRRHFQFARQEGHLGHRERRKHWDLQWPIEDASIAIHTMKDEDQALELIRHDFAHIMARAVQEIWPDVKVTIGPVIENGWYYDFDREEPFTPEDLGAIEKKMKEIINAPRSLSAPRSGTATARQTLRGRRALQGRADRGDPR